MSLIIGGLGNRIFHIKSVDDQIKFPLRQFIGAGSFTQLGDDIDGEAAGDYTRHASFFIF